MWGALPAESSTPRRRRSKDEAAGFRRAGDPVRARLGPGAKGRKGNRRRPRHMCWLSGCSKSSLQVTALRS